MFKECLNSSINLKDKLLNAPRDSGIIGMKIGSTIGELTGFLIGTIIIDIPIEIINISIDNIYPKEWPTCTDSPSIRTKYIMDIGKDFAAITGFSMGLMISVPIVMPIQAIDEALQYTNITNFDITETIYDYFS